MPFSETSNGVNIYYRRYGHGSTKVLLIIGLAGTHDSWGPQIKGLTGSIEPNDNDDSEAAPYDSTNQKEGSNLDQTEEEDEGIEICCFDNRGMGRSSVPANKSDYTTTKMAGDALALLDHLGWKKAHVFGHSMGSMIACKLAALAPERLCSLALLNATGGGFECFPKFDRQMMSIAYRFLRAKSPEQRAHVDLDTHYTKEYLDEYVGSTTRRMILYQEYVKGISSTGMQSNHGFEGQVNACWTHKMTSKELDTIRSAGFPISVIHGRYDIIAQLCHAKRLAEKLQPAARMVELHGAHLVSHERPDEVAIISTYTPDKDPMHQYFHLLWPKKLPLVSFPISGNWYRFQKPHGSKHSPHVILFGTSSKKLHQYIRVLSIFSQSDDTASLIGLFEKQKIQEKIRYNDQLSINTCKVNQALKELITASNAKEIAEDWSYIPECESGWLVLRMPLSLSKFRSDGANNLLTIYSLLGKLQLSFLYIIGLLVMGFDHVKSAFCIMKPVRVATIEA